MTTPDEQHAADTAHAEDIARRQREHRERIAQNVREAEEARTAKEAATKAQAAAVAAFGLLVVNSGPGQPWEAFQCDEIETVAQLLDSFGLGACAQVVIDEHSDADDQVGDAHHDRWLLRHGETEAA